MNGKKLYNDIFRQNKIILSEKNVIKCLYLKKDILY